MRRGRESRPVKWKARHWRRESRLRTSRREGSEGAGIRAKEQIKFDHVL